MLVTKKRKGYFLELHALDSPKENQLDLPNRLSHQTSINSEKEDLEKESKHQDKNPKIEIDYVLTDSLHRSLSSLSKSNEKTLGKQTDEYKDTSNEWLSKTASDSESDEKPKSEEKLKLQESVLEKKYFDELSHILRTQEKWGPKLTSCSSLGDIPPLIAIIVQYINLKDFYQDQCKYLQDRRTMISIQLKEATDQLNQFQSFVNAFHLTRRKEMNFLINYFYMYYSPDQFKMESSLNNNKKSHFFKFKLNRYFLCFTVDTSFGRYDLKSIVLKSSQYQYISNLNSKQLSRQCEFWNRKLFVYLTSSQVIHDSTLENHFMERRTLRDYCSLQPNSIDLQTDSLDCILLACILCSYIYYSKYRLAQKR